MVRFNNEKDFLKFLFNLFHGINLGYCWPVLVTKGQHAKVVSFIFFYYFIMCSFFLVSVSIITQISLLKEAQTLVTRAHLSVKNCIYSAILHCLCCGLEDSDERKSNRGVTVERQGVPGTSEMKMNWKCLEGTAACFNSSPDNFGKFKLFN